MTLFYSKQANYFIKYIMKVIAGVSLILGCFFGAGFVSGREIAFYFGRFGCWSILSIIVSVILFFLLTLFFFRLSDSSKSFSDFSVKYFGKASNIVNWLLCFCILIISSSMLAGTQSLAIALNINNQVFVAFTLFLSFLILIGNLKSLIKINLILLPVILIIMIIISCNVGNKNINFGEGFGAIVSGVNYVFINIVTLGMFILEIGGKYTKKEKFYICVISSFVVGGLLVLLNFAIMRNGLVDDLMPNLTLARFNSFVYVIMQVCIYLGLFTTLISNVLLLANFVNTYIKNYILSVLVMLVISFILSFVGFKFIVGYVYSFVGVVGAFMILYIGVFSKKYQKNKEKS